MLSWTVEAPKAVKSTYVVAALNINVPGTKVIVASPSSSLIRTETVSPSAPKVKAVT